MRQLLLRVPDEIHARLAAQAERDATSMNAVATALLDASLDVQLTDPRVRARERLHLLGVLVEVDAASGTIPSSRAEAIAAFALLDVDAVDLIDEGRG